MRKLTIIIFILVPASQVVAESDAAQWEFGLGVGGISVPHYRGSDQNYNLVGPTPYVRYSGDRLKIDREGGRYYFYDGKSLKLDLSAAFALPVDSDDNQAREDMPDLDAILELGPRLQWYLWQSRDNNLRLRLAAPIRAAINLSTGDTEGYVFSPYFQIRYYSVMETAVSLGPMWATERYHDYYYQVETQYATTQRPAYDAQSGYSGFRFTLTNSHRVNKYTWWGMFLRYDNLSGTSFVNSPLVKQNHSLIVGISAAYIFKPVDWYYRE